MPRRWILWLAAGLVLRLIFISFPRPVDDDTWDYLQMGHNLFHYGIYGTGTGDDMGPSTYRLPGYPIFLATFELLFARIWPNTWFTTVFLFQTAVDLVSGLLLAAFARRQLSARAAEVTLVLAMLCPFTAVYSAIAMTECLSLFAISLGLYAAGRAITAEASGTRDVFALILAGCAAALGTLLRPDGIFLCGAIAIGLFFYTLRSCLRMQPALIAMRRSVAATSIFCFVALLPLVPWTVRNWQVFHIFQPLAPRYADPGELSIAGARRWLRTWTVDFVDTAVVCWHFPGDFVDPLDIPQRAFDSPQQRAYGLELLAQYNRDYVLTPSLIDRFGAIAAQNIEAHPIRYYFGLPILRDADMMFRPRTLEFGLDVFWWRWSEHPTQTVWAVLLGLLNLFYVAAAVWAFLRRRVPWALMLGSYLILRFILLGAMENPEPRYTVQCFPILIVAAAAALTRSRPGAQDELR
ncbi:MAG TPA: glycosyltransferase family 39 protein [Terracidiphilus sp.]